jgi:hypothetical protein
MDLLLFVATPLLIVPLAWGVQSAWAGANAEIIGLIVSAFGGLGHHLPGMIRAYGDRDLFHRFRMRFILAPLFLLAVCIPLARNHLNAMLVILSVWGCWHALMQVYGFVRIYDVKVGSIAPTTARWDWLMCVCWFTCGQVFSNGKLARLLESWYDSGGPLVPPTCVHAIRWTWLAASVGVLIGFLFHHVVQSRIGPRPNPVKLLMLASGIGFWWFAMVFVENIVLGIALFEIFHDVQYLAIVWLYNCRRVNTSPNLGAFMRFLFRRGHGMAWLYVGLVFAYGLIGLASLPLQNSSLKETLTGLVWASTILHFYYDGFIWKVRESTTRAGLGLNTEAAPPRLSGMTWGEFGHLLKWSPLVALLSWLTSAELSGSALTEESTEKRLWPQATQLERAQNIAAAVPGDLRAQRQAAITLSQHDRSVDAIRLLNAVLEKHPEYAEGYRILGEIYHLRGDLTEAGGCYRVALRVTKRRDEETLLHHRLGEVHLLQQDVAGAEREFQEALRLDPTFEPTLATLVQLKRGTKDSP